MEVAAELGDVDLVENKIGEGRRAPVRFGWIPDILLVSKRERRQLADTELARTRIDDPVEAADVRVFDAVAVEVSSGTAPGGALY